MKKIQYHLIFIVISFLIFQTSGQAQDTEVFEVSYDIQRVYKPLSISKSQLLEAKTVQDLNTHYKESWIKEYLSVEILTLINGEIKKEIGKTGELSIAQINNLKKADTESDISVNVRYIPKNNLKANEIKEMNFSFMVDPEKEAKYTGGSQAMKNYIAKSVKSRISNNKFRQHHLSAVKFTIDENGHVADVHILESSSDKKVDEILLEAVCNMSPWEPAQYADGKIVKQQFVLTAGDTNSCVVNLLGIRKFPSIAMSSDK